MTTILGVDPGLKDPQLKTNADIVAECVQLGYVGGLMLDPTYGDGKWWTAFELECGLLGRPPLHVRSPNGPYVGRLTPHDLYKLDGVDFRYLPHLSETFDTVTYDPPYCAKGGRKTSGILEMDGRYGQDTAPSTPAQLQKLVNDGLSECERVLKPGGHMLVKCMNYISGGEFWPGEHLTWEHAVNVCQLTQVDQFIHANDGGPQPSTNKCLECGGSGQVWSPPSPLLDLGEYNDCSPCGGSGKTPRRQLHARNNCSVQFVFQKR